MPGLSSIIVQAAIYLGISCRHYRETAVLHWFLGQRLIDPGAGREEGGVSHWEGGEAREGAKQGRRVM